MIRLPALAAAAALLVVLTACGPGTPTPTGASGSPTPTTSDEAEPTDAAADRPTPGFGDGCAGLVPASLIETLSPGAAPHDLLASEYGVRPWIPRNASIGQLRGMLCEWSNGEPYSSAFGASAFRGIQLVVLPDAASGWIEFTSAHGYDSEAGYLSCTESIGFCHVDFFADGYWFAGEVYVAPRAGLEADFVALVTHLRAEAATFGRAEAPWLPDGHVPMPNDCAVVLPASLVDEVFGVSHDLNEGDGGGGWSVWAEAMSRTQDWGCGWFGESADFSLQWLNGGAWLATELGATGGTPLPLTGLAEGDSATISCDAAGCHVDLIVGGNWVVATAIGASDPSAAATRLASHVVGVVRG
jgi:hypothetical protein